MRITQSVLIFTCMLLLSFEDTDAGENPYPKSAEGGAQARFLIVRAILLRIAANVSDLDLTMRVGDIIFRSS